MMPRKKLEYYANMHGVKDYAAVKLTDGQVAEICARVGSKKFSSSDCGGRLSPLIDLITDDGDFAEKNRAALGGKSVSDDFFSIRLADHAADQVMAAYADITK